MNYTPIPKLMCPICRNHSMVYATDYYKHVTGLTSVTCDICGYQNSIIGILFILCNTRTIWRFEFPDIMPLLEQFPWAREWIYPMTKRDWALVYSEECFEETMVLERQIEALYPILNRCVRWDSNWTNRLPVLSDRRIRRIGYTRQGFQSIDYLDNYMNQKGVLTDMVLPIYREENHLTGLLQLYQPLSISYQDRNACGTVRHKIGFEQDPIRLCYRETRDWNTLIITEDVLSYLKLSYWFYGLSSTKPTKFKLPAQIVLVQDTESMQVLLDYAWKAQTIIFATDKTFTNKSMDMKGRLHYDRCMQTKPWEIPVTHIVTSIREFEKNLIPWNGSTLPK